MSRSKTSFPEEEGKPSDAQLLKLIYSEPLIVTDKYKMKNPLVFGPEHIYKLTFEDLADIPLALHHDEKSSTDTADDTIVRNCLNDLCEAVVEIETKNIQRVVVDQMVDCTNEMKLYGSKPEIREESEQKFYDNIIGLDLIDIIHLCLNTAKPSECKEWFAARKLRISASLRAHKIKTIKRKIAEELANDFLQTTDLSQLSAIVYGNKNEKTALKTLRRVQRRSSLCRCIDKASSTLAHVLVLMLLLLGKIKFIKLLK